MSSKVLCNIDVMVAIDRTFDDYKKKFNDAIAEVFGDIEDFDKQNRIRFRIEDADASNTYLAVPDKDITMRFTWYDIWIYTSNGEELEEEFKERFTRLKAILKESFKDNNLKGLDDSFDFWGYYLSDPDLQVQLGMEDGDEVSV